MENKFWEVKNAATKNEGDIYIYGDIVSYKWYEEDTTAKSFKEDLDALEDVDILNVYINSSGGSVFQGQAILNILKRYNATIKVHIDGIAASIASVIAMAGDTIFMPKNSMMMIHNPWTFSYGNAKELRKQADDLDKIRESLIEAYLGKTGDKLSKGKLIDLMDAETWLTADECYAYGLCDEIEEEKNVEASINKDLMNRYINTPEQYRNHVQKPKKPEVKDTIEKDEEIEAIIARINNKLK